MIVRFRCFFQRATSPQTGRSTYTVIDGQQRLRAIFEYLDERYRLASGRKPYSGKQFSELKSPLQEKIRNYDLVIEELSGYTENDIRDMFIRINRYVVSLSPQELRHAKGSGRFHTFVERLGSSEFWTAQKIFSKQVLSRMRAVEFSAELTILLIEGPQDKKKSIDLYYGRYQHSFADAEKISSRLKSYFQWITKALPNLSRIRYRRPVDFYSLIGALDQVSSQGKRLGAISHERAGVKLLALAAKMQEREPVGDAAKYLVAASRQTDNITPRTTRINILEKMLRA